MIRKCSVLVLLALLSGCAGLENAIEAPRVSLAGLTLDSMSVLEQRYTLTLRVENPNGITVPVRSLSYAVRLAGADFVSGTTPESFSVPARDATLVNVGVTTNVLETARQLRSFLAGNPDAIDYSLNGDVAIDLPFVEPIPFSRSGQVAFSSLVGR